MHSLLSPQKILAQIKNPLLDQGIYNTSDPLTTASRVIQTFVTVMFTLASLYFIIYFIFAGYNFITSEGDKSRLEVAKNQLTYAFLGFGILLSLFAVLSLIKTITGIDMIKITIPTIDTI